MRKDSLKIKWEALLASPVELHPWHRAQGFSSVWQMVLEWQPTALGWVWVDVGGALSCSFPRCHIKQSGTKTPLTRTHASYPHVHVLSAAGRPFIAVKCCLSPGQEKRLSDWPVVKEPQQLLSAGADKRMPLSGWWWTCSSLSEDR